MTTHYVRVQRAALTDPVNDSGDRSIMPMSTLIGLPESEAWLLEAPFKDESIGDIQIFRNEGIGHNGQRLKTIVEGKSVDAPDVWVWWGSVPHARIKSYKLHLSEPKLPKTLEDGEALEDGEDQLPFLTDAQRKEKSQQAGKGGAAST
jgi:hypothetical protein